MVSLAHLWCYTCFIAFDLTRDHFTQEEADDAVHHRRGCDAATDERAIRRHLGSGKRLFTCTVNVTVFVSGTFDLFNVTCKEHNRSALNTFQNVMKNSDISGTCKQGLRSKINNSFILQCCSFLLDYRECLHLHFSKAKPLADLRGDRALQTHAPSPYKFFLNSVQFGGKMAKIIG